MYEEFELSTSKYCCIACNKQYTRKSSLDKHKILCEFKMKTKREQQIDSEELGDVPTHFQLVQIVQELTLKLIKMEEKMEQMQKWVDKKKRKLNVVMWLNSTLTPSVGFLEWAHNLKIGPEHFEDLMENSIFHTLQHVFEENLAEKPDFVYPIACFTQKSGVFYVCELTEDGHAEWRLMVLADMVLMLKKIQNGIICELTKWKTDNQSKFDDSDKISILFNKAVIKLMNISFTQDSNMSRVKNGLYNFLKTDLKSVEFDFEF